MMLKVGIQIKLSFTFWNDYLSSVEASDTFTIGDTELIGASFNEVRPLIDETPKIDNDDIFLTANFDRFNMMWFMTLDWQITSVIVGVDPDTLPGQPPS